MTLLMPTDQPARDRIANDLDTTLIVEAAAGTGKTTALVSRMMGVLMSGRGQLDGMVAVTFTEAAAGELKLRLRTEIERKRNASETSGEVRDRLVRALPQLEVARIGTIHSFCAELLRERPVEAGVDPRFQMADKDVSNILLGQAFARWFEETLANPGEGVRRVLRRRHKDGPRRRLLQAATQLVEHRDHATRWAASPFERRQEIDGLIADMRSLATRLDAYPPYDRFSNSLRELHRFVCEVDRLEAISGERDYDGLEGELIGMLSRPRNEHWAEKGYVAPRSKSASDEERRFYECKKQDIARRDELHQRVIAFERDVGAELAPHLQTELLPVVERYSQLKERGGYLDFLDLLLRARDLVRNNAEVRRELQGRFTHVFVDEFQDTDPVQTELLLLLAADDPRQHDWEQARPAPAKLFLVGDPKQSIYRFRRADVGLYKRTVDRLVKGGACVVHLSVSFRSAPAIQQAVNAAFSRCMDGASPSQAAYVALQPHRPAIEGQPSVVVLPPHAPFSARGNVTRTQVASCLPETVAAFIEWLVTKSGWTVSGPGEQRLSLRPQHVCLLFKNVRSFGEDLTRPFVRGLEARNISHILVGGSALHQREEVEGLRNALAAIERPDDELSMYATLRGPFFALDDGTLLAWRQRFRSLHPFRKVAAPATEHPQTSALDEVEPAFREVADALTLMRELHLGRNRRPIAATIGRLLEATRAHAGLAIWPGGEQALANVNRLLDRARAAEKSGLISFRSFVDALMEEAESGEAGEAPIVEEGTEGVRLMTVHGAKGLEFPVVILADPTTRPVWSSAERWVDSSRRLCALRLVGCSPRELLEHGDEELASQEEEARRLLYVAATRARDLLVVAAAADKRLEGWLDPLHPALYPPADRAQSPSTRHPGGCPTFGSDTVLERFDQRPATSVSPGQHRPEAGDHEVVWWDPTGLRLEVEETLGLRQQRLLVTDEKAMVSQAGIEAHAAWQRRREEVRVQGARPELRVMTATEAAAAGALPVASVRIERVTWAHGRPHGRRFGVLVHAVLASVDLDAGPDEIRACAHLQRRLLGASDEEAAAAVDAAVRALATPLMRRAAEAARDGRCRRELPVSVLLEDGTLIEGVLDAAFLTPGEADHQPLRADSWTLVDFKTDVDASARLEEYHAQVSLYARALSQATGRDVSDVVLLLV